MPSPQTEPASINVYDTLSAARNGRELTIEEAAHLLKLRKPDETKLLREAADEVRARQCGNDVPYRMQASIFFTNLCEMNPVIYPYAQEPDSRNAFILSVDDIDERLESACDQDIRHISLTGGMWSTLQIPGLETPNLLKTYARLTHYIREHLLESHITGFSPDEIDFLHIVSGRSHRYILELLRDNGLKALTGNGAEILIDPLREKISPKKAKTKTWFTIVKTARQLSIPVSATVGYGHFETPAQTATHFDKIRAFVKANPGALSGFVPQPVPYQHKQAQRHGFAMQTPQDRFNLLAVARLMLGEWLPAQQTHWALESAKTEAAVAEAQEGLTWGASAFGPSDALSYPAFLSGSRRPDEAFSDADAQAIIRAADRNPKTPV